MTQSPKFRNPCCATARRMADPDKELHARKVDCDIGGACAGAPALWRSRLAGDAAVVEHVAGAGGGFGDGHGADAGRDGRWRGAAGAGACWAGVSVGAGGCGVFARALVSVGLAGLLPAAIAGHAGHERWDQGVGRAGIGRHGGGVTARAVAGGGGAGAARDAGVSRPVAPRARDVSA